MTTSPDAQNSFCEENEDELKVLARVLVTPKAGEVAAAAAALLVKALTGSSVASGVVEQVVTKAFGQRFADTPDARLLAAAQTFRKAQEHRAALQEFADAVAPLINQATVDAKRAIATLRRSQQHLFEGQQEGFDILARALSEVLDGVGRLESGQAELPAVVARAVGLSKSAEAPVLPASVSASRLYNVPQPSLSFVGRLDELERLGVELAVCRHVRVCASVEGLPGIGKTELVLRLAHQLAAQNRYPGGVFWLSAEDPNLELTWASEEISGALGISSGTAAERARRVVNLLSRLSDPVLVILDNVETWSEATKPSPLPSGMHVTVLVTTRRRDLGGSRFSHFSLGFLSPADSRKLLSSIAGGRVEEQEGFDELLAQLDGHALAVELAAVYLREVPDMTPAEYLAKLVVGARLDATVAEQVRYEATVEQAFTLLWKCLDANTQYLWQLAAQFAPVVVSASLANACGMNAEARRTLRRYHLIEVADDGGFRMHRLTRGFGRCRNDLLPRKDFIYGVAGRAVESDLESFFRIYGPDRLHFEEALRRSATPEDTAAWTILLHRVGTALHSIGEMTRARELLELTLECDVRRYGEDHPDVAASRTSVAAVLKDLGELTRARVHAELALQSAIRNFGEDHHNVAAGRSNLAAVLQELGDLPLARELLELALKSNIRNLGEDDPSVATVRSNLGGVLLSLGESTRAREQLELALSSDLQNFGEDDPRVAASRCNLAGVLQKLGDLAHARELLELALKSGIENFGEDHHSVSVNRSNLAGVLREMGALNSARELVELALKSDIKNFGEDHPTVSTSRLCLAVVLRDLGELPAALEQFELASVSRARRIKS